MAYINVVPDPDKMLKQADSRPMMIHAAAKTLSQLPLDIVVGMCSSETGKFVQAVRQVYKTEGFLFTDDDLREIHAKLREMAADQINKAGLGVSGQN